MAMTIQCDIVSAEASIFSGPAEMVVATGLLGELGVIYGHAPLLTGLVPGSVRVIKPGHEEEVFYVSGGFLEVQPGGITLLADTAIRAASIDEAAAQQAIDDANRLLADQRADIDYSAATAQLAEAMAQLRTLAQLRKKLGK